MSKPSRKQRDRSEPSARSRTSSAWAAARTGSDRSPGFATSAFGAANLFAVGHALQHALEPVDPEWLRQHRAVAIELRQAALVVAGGEHERSAAGRERFRHWGDRFASDIDVEDRQIKLAGSQRLECSVDTRGLGRDDIAELAEHVLQHNADHRVVLDDEHAFAAWRGRASKIFLGLRWRLAGGRFHVVSPECSSAVILRIYAAGELPAQIDGKVY